MMIESPWQDQDDLVANPGLYSNQVASSLCSLLRVLVRGVVQGN